MTKSQDTKNEQQKDLCITSEQLTEQLKKNELKLGKHYYYTTIFSPTVYIQNFTRDAISFQDFKETVAEVLAPVPSYSEYLALQSDSLAKNEGVEINAELENSIKDLKHRNENLRLALKTYELPEIQKILTDWRTGELDKKFNKFEKENSQLKTEYEKECKRADELEDSYWKEVEKNKKLKKWCEEFNALEVAKENTKLKELLKECKPYINHSAVRNRFRNSAGNKKDMKLLTKIDEVI